VPDDFLGNFAAGSFASHWNKNSNPAWAFDTWFLNLNIFIRPAVFTHNGGGYATLSFIPTLGTMILGLIAGGSIKQGGAWWAKVGTFVLTGGVLIAIAWLAHESGLCPAVKRVWTPSWTLYSGGWCLFFLAAFYCVIDGAKLSSWSFPLRVIGANSILAYIMAHGCENFIVHSIKIHTWPTIFEYFGPAYEPLVAGGIVLVVFWLILYWLYRQKVFIRI